MKKQQQQQQQQQHRILPHRMNDTGMQWGKKKQENSKPIYNDNGVSKLLISHNNTMRMQMRL